MIYCNLESLISSRKTNLSAVSKATGISRTTLTSLCTNKCQGVQLETVDTLCKYFNIDMGELFLFTKYDLSVTGDLPFIEIEKKPYKDTGVIFVNIERNNTKYSCALACVLYFHYNDDTNKIYWIETEISLFDEKENEHDHDIEKNNTILRKALHEIQPEFKRLLASNISSYIQDEYELYTETSLIMDLTYPSELTEHN